MNGETKMLVVPPPGEVLLAGGDGGPGTKALPAGDGGNIVLMAGRGGYPNGKAGVIIFKSGGAAGMPEKELFRVLPDGAVVIAADVPVSEAAREFWECVNMLRSQHFRDCLSKSAQSE
jgi:hypothetical protein